MIFNFDKSVVRNGTFSVKHDLKKEIFGKTDIIPMWVADMDFETPPFIIDALQKRLEHQIFGYHFRPEEYFSTINSWLLRRHNWKIKNDWICFSPGIVPALSICTLAFTEPGDKVIVQPPVYFPFFPAVESHSRKLVYNQLKEKNGKWEMNFDDLRKKASEGAKMLILSNPHNPVGRAWTENELEEMASICLENEILIISDEIHSDLVLPGYSHNVIANISEEVANSTITCIAPSKTFNLAGLSTSSMIISNPELREKFQTVIENIHIGGGTTFGTTASIAAYSQGDEWLNQLLEYLAVNVNYVIDYCRDYLPGIVPVVPEATYMIWLDCRNTGIEPSELGKFFVEEASVGMNEGSIFGPGGKGYMRINIACPLSTLKQALEQIKNALMKKSSV